MKWPNNKDFAFTIVDDTDNSTVENIKPVYDLLHELGFKTTKTVWVYPSRDHFTGETLQDEHYLSFIKDLENKGFEIGLHNVGSGRFTRDEIIKGINEFKSLFPKAKIHINHSSNPDNIYWGAARFNFFTPLYKLILKLTKSKRQYFGNNKESDLYWSDIAKKEFKYIRNLVFNNIDTLKSCPKTPYIDKGKPESNYWFSSSDGHTFNEFMELTKPDNLKQLIKNGGGSIVYTHFASGFVEDGVLNPEFKQRMIEISKMNGYFETTSTILNLLNKNNTPNKLYFIKQELTWAFQRLMKRLKFGH